MDNNRIVTHNWVKDNIDSAHYKTNQNIPSTNKCMNKSEVLQYLRVKESVLDSMPLNQLIEQEDIIFDDFHGITYHVFKLTTGKYLVSGDMTINRNVDGQLGQHVNLMRLNQDLSIDYTFPLIEYPSMYHHYYLPMTVDNSDRFYLGYNKFNHLVEGAKNWVLERYLSNGQLDTSWSVDLYDGLLFHDLANIDNNWYDEPIAKIYFNNNKLFILGYSDDYYIESPLMRVYNITPTGLTVDPISDNNTFLYPKFTYKNPVDMKFLSDGKFLIFTDNMKNLQTNKYAHAVRLLSNGSLDTSFSYETDAIDDTNFVGVEETNDGKYIAIGGFDGKNIIRLNNSGIIDTSFPNILYGNPRFILKLDTNKYMILAENTSTYNGSQTSIIVINNNNVRDNTFPNITSTSSFHMLSGGVKISDGFILNGVINAYGNRSDTNSVIKVSNNLTYLN